METGNFWNCPEEEIRMPQLASTVPFRRVGHKVQILLVTSKKKGDWIFPKGNIDTGDTPATAALKETWEEAGVLGDLVEPPVTQYPIDSKEPGKMVTVFLLCVREVGKDWPEKSVRKRRWVPLEKAEKVLAKSQLKEILPRIEEAIQAEICISGA
jgi:8-oxo-dGTP pyrophosphatase MutT (NUDIX family)